MTGDAGASEKVGGRRRRLRGLFGLLLLALPLILGACQETTPEDLSAALRELNADRAAYQLAPLRQDPTLNAKAHTWAKHLRDTCTLSHSVLTEDLIDAVVRQVVTSWCATATPEALISLRRGEPFIPGDLDRTLLLDLSSRSGVYDIDDESRHALRETFWGWINRLKLS